MNNTRHCNRGNTINKGSADEMSPLECATRCPLFKGVDPERLVRLMEGFSPIEYEKGEKLLSVTNGVRHIGFIVRGKARVTRSTGKNGVLMSILTPPGLIGAATLFRDNANAATEVLAMDNCKVLWLGQAEFSDMLRDNFDITLNYLAYLTDRIHFITDRIECIGSMDAASKVLSFIQQNAKDGIVELPYSVCSLADTLSIGRATLYRSLDELCTRGIIERNGRTIHLLGVDS